LSAWQVPKQIFIVDEIPVNERGKISRRELARRFGE
jgi:acyl-CoA synthetase (AMP-forming)/AMP-acid ligase II